MSRALPDGWQNYRLDLSYDGREFAGWQRLRDARTVQGTLETACVEVLGAASAVQGAGRTDRGVHARGQVASVQGPAFEGDVVAAFEQALPADLQVHAVIVMPTEFHARESAVGKEYRYVLWNGGSCPTEREEQVWSLQEPVSAAAMRDAAPVLVGEHDFASFAKPSRHARASSVREVSRVEVIESGPSIEIVVRGRSFMHKMIRNLVRALVRVGEGQWSREDLASALAARDRGAAPGTAPASGLWLDRVFYDEAAFRGDDD